ncbi:response regulator [Sorangium sp. So ce1014]|uniref:response regulator n=1 Tax=Sorangium sp. So ce1014 TaxID=3133326 RepID=UPI003F5F230B
MQATRRVLVVDDEEGMRATVAANLELEGYEVVEARDGAHALDLVRQQRFALVLSDVKMPGLNGVETFRELRRIQPDLTVIAMTGHAAPEMIHAFTSRGGYACLRKPFDVRELMHTIARARSDPGTC